MAQIPFNQKTMLLSALTLVSAGIGELAKHYENDPKIHDFLENFGIGLMGFQSELSKL